MQSNRVGFWRIGKQIVATMLLLLLVAFLLCGCVNVDSINLTDVNNTANFSTDTIYQIVTDRFFDGDTTNNPTGEIFDKANPRKYHGGDWAGITSKIKANYFTNMGITALWITSPIENITTIDPSNNCSAYHGYWGRDYFTTNEYFGTFADFATLVDTAHDKQIKIVIDFAPNHTSTAEYGDMVFNEDGKLYRDGKLVGGYKEDAAGIFNHEGWTDYSSLENGTYHSMYGLADLNHLNSVVDTYMKDAINKWLDLGVDGIRVDAVKHMPLGWQKNWLSSIYQHKQVFVFGEWFFGGTDDDAQMQHFANESGMSLLDFRFANAVRGALGDGGMTMRQLSEVITATDKDFNEVNDQVTFIDNHDISRFANLTNGKRRRLESAYVMLMTSRGIPTVYYGSEQYMTGAGDPYNRGDMQSFDIDSQAYKVISRLAPLRKSNLALAFGSTTHRYVNDDVLVFERKFGDNVVLTAINRSSSQAYDISGSQTALPDGSYVDVLEGIQGGDTLTVNGSAVENYYLEAGQSAVWQYKANKSTAAIGNVDAMLGKAGNLVTISGAGFGKIKGKVEFGSSTAIVESWTDSCIVVKVPQVKAGTYDITVATSKGVKSNIYSGYKVLTGSQVPIRFKVNDAITQYGDSVYVVGNVEELGSWDTNRAIGAMFNATASIGSYPTWFYDISAPSNTTIEYRYIIKNSNGDVVGQSEIFTFNTGSQAGEAVTSW